MKPPTLAPAYCCLYPQLAEVARAHGYALAIHGTMVRDLDLVAIPWVDTATDAQTLVTAIVAVLDGRQPMAGRCKAGIWEEVDLSQPSQMPHGRLVWTIILEGGAFIDFGVMPRRGDEY